MASNEARAVSGDDLGRGAPGIAARGRGPNREGEYAQRDDTAPSAGWGAARSVLRVLAATREPLRGPQAIVKMNHENGGFDCPGCAWPDDRKGLHLDICENGIKHVTWEMTHKRADPAFFARHQSSPCCAGSTTTLGRVISP